MDYTKEDMDRLLDYSCERAAGDTLKGIDLASPPSVSTPGKVLQDLIDSAEDGSTKHIPSGHYEVDQALHVDKNLTLIGDGSVAIDAKNTRQILILGRDKSNIAARIENITFINSKGDYGGAIRTKAQKLVLENCVLKNNIAYEGSGLYCDGGDLSILNSTISANVGIANTVSMPYGGKLILDSTDFNNNVVIEDANSLFFLGDSNQLPEPSSDNWMYRHKPREVFEDYLKGIYSKDLEATIINCTFHDNVAKGYGAAVSEVVAVGDVLIANSGFRSNQGDKYGGVISAGGDSVVIKGTNVVDNTINVWGPSSGIKIYGGNVLIDRCLVSGNHFAKNGEVECGGITIFENTTAEITNSTITSNEGNVGGLYIEPNTTVSVKDCNISGNAASNVGGAVYNKGTMVMNNPKISKNTAKKDAGAIFNSGNLTINGGMISDNAAINGSGGAIMTTDRLNLNGTVICYNHARGFGGAIFSKGFTNLTSNNQARIFSNEAYLGGGIFVTGAGIWESSGLGVNGVLIRNNTAAENGGGIFVCNGADLIGDTSYVTANAPDNIYYHWHPDSKIGYSQLPPLP